MAVRPRHGWPPFRGSGLKACRWFSRGWTLQELLAPTEVVFFDRKWDVVGSRSSLQSAISEVTGIANEALTNRDSLEGFSIATRMSWAANRHTTRLEDQAYSLFGLMDVNVPLLYGEGSRAFTRLQEEIIRSNTDQSIHAWNPSKFLLNDRPRLFASSPDDFADFGEVIRWRPEDYFTPHRIGAEGLQLTIPVLQEITASSQTVYYGVLNARHQDNLKGPLALCLVPTLDGYEDVERGIRPSSFFVDSHHSEGHGRVRVVPLNKVIFLEPARIAIQYGPAKGYNPPLPRLSHGMPRVWVSLEGSFDHDMSSIERYPSKYWTKTDIFSTATIRDTPPAYIVFGMSQRLKERGILRRSETHDATSFAALFCASPQPGTFRLAILKPSETPYWPSHADTPMLDVVQFIAEKCADASPRPIRLRNGLIVDARVELTTRMREEVYIIRVTARAVDHGLC